MEFAEGCWGFFLGIPGVLGLLSLARLDRNWREPVVPRTGGFE